MEYRGLTQKQIEDIVDAALSLREVSDWATEEEELEYACAEFLATLEDVA